MRHFPVFLDLDGRRAIIAGGTGAAAAKWRLLSRSGAAIQVIAPVLEDGFDALIASHGATRHTARAFRPADLDGVALVYAATGDRAEDARIAAAARQAGIPVNVVDRSDLCDFITPAIVDRAPITVAISSDGKAPALARFVKARIDALLPSGLGRLGLLAEEFRDAAKRLLPSADARRRFWDRVFGGGAGHEFLALDGGFGRERIMKLMNAEAAKAAPQGRVAIVGAGPGDPDLLTLKAHRALQQADVIVHDKLVSDAVLDFARRDARRIYVGKTRGHHSMRQEDINALLAGLAQAGHYVVRLKGGDPFVFGRGGEEVADLEAAGVAVEVVPGVTAATGCAAEALLPLTHRDHASAVSFVAGQLKGLDEQDWRGLAGPGRTLVIYMGLSAAPSIAAKLLADGVDAATPVAILENGTRPGSRRILTSLAALPAAIHGHGVVSPSLIVVGAVAALAHDAQTTLPTAIKAVA